MGKGLTARNSIAEHPQSKFWCCPRPDINNFADMWVCLSCGQDLSQLGPAPRLSSTHEYNNSLANAPSICSIPYSYSDLTDGEFRLIELEAGNFDDPLICEIFHDRIDEGIFEAVSYTWANALGSTALTKQIVVSQSRCLGSRYVQVTANCEDALRRIRSTTDSKTLWIDAICINQADPVERGHQVRYMPSIYARAKHVLVYLGEAADGSDHVMEGLQFGTVDNPMWSNIKQYSTIPGLNISYQGALNAFLSRPWFSRIWCLQEVGMATDITAICGSRVVAWGQFLIAEFDRFKLDPRLGESVGRLPFILRLPLRGQQPLMTLYGLLIDARLSCKASDPRDMVYALLGLVEQSEASGIEANYNLAVSDVYHHTTRCLIELYGTLDVLGDAEFKPSVKPGLASWAIDWSCSSIQSPVADPPNRQCSAPSLTGKSVWFGYTPNHNGNRFISAKADAEEVNIDNVLFAKGYKLASVVAVSDPWQQGNSCPTNLKQWSATIRSNDARIDRHSWLSQVQAKLRRAIPHETALLIQARVQAHKSLPRAEASSNASFKRRKINGRRWFITDEGHIGFGPPSLRSDDVLCKFLASSIGHFLRPEGKHYIYLGECYIGVRCSELEQFMVHNTAEIFEDTIERAEQIFEIW